MNALKRAVGFDRFKRMTEGGFLLLAAFILLLFATRSSFLYPYNDWNDANSYFSVGKALFHGKMPYRDVFDQKGMYLYFFYGLSYLVSHTTFAGVFVMEVILAFFDLAGFFHILQLYVRREMALFLSPLVLAVVISSKSFYWGGSAEEICFPFLVWGLFLSLKYFKRNYPESVMSWKEILSGGVMAGMIANTKFTVLGFYFAWMMCIAFSFLVKKNFWGAVKGCLIFLGGMAVPFVPWLIYFGVQNSLYEWYWGYVYINVFVYSNLNSKGPGIVERIYTLSKLFYWIVRDNLVYFCFLIPGTICFFLGKEKKWLERFHLLALCVFLFLGIYIGGGTLPYYALPLAVFTVMGFAYLGQGLEWLLRQGKKNLAGWNRKINAVSLMLWGLFISVLLGWGIVWRNSINIPFMQMEKEMHFLSRFKKVVEKEENPTLLNIGCLDAGLYTVCDIVPACRWFQTQTLAIDDVLKEQERYIAEGQTTFVIARDDYPEVIWENYELTAQEEWYQDGKVYTYYLFRRNS